MSKWRNLVIFDDDHNVIAVHKRVLTTTAIGVRLAHPGRHVHQWDPYTDKERVCPDE